MQIDKWVLENIINILVVPSFILKWEIIKYMKNTFLGWFRFSFNWSDFLHWINIIISFLIYFEMLYYFHDYSKAEFQYLRLAVWDIHLCVKHPYSIWDSPHCKLLKQATSLLSHSSPQCWTSPESGTGGYFRITSRLSW